MKRDDFWAGALVRGRVEAFAELRGDAAHPALRRDPQGTGTLTNEELPIAGA
jgi:hypothetical protein